MKGYRRLHRQAQKRYRKKQKAKEKHREDEKRRRWRIWEKEYGGYKEKNNLNKQWTSFKDYKRSALITAKHRVAEFKKCAGDKGYCYLCREQGIIVKEFPRRGYGS